MLDFISFLFLLQYNLEFFFLNIFSSDYFVEVDIFFFDVILEEKIIFEMSREKKRDVLEEKISFMMRHKVHFVEVEVGHVVHTVRTVKEKEKE